MTKPFVLGLTGSIGMGKSTTAGFFRDAGVPVWDADAAVTRLYSKGGGAVTAISAICPEAIQDEAVDRNALKAWILQDDSALAKIESVVHPLVALDREEFVAKAEADGETLVVLDIPLLYEKGYEADMDGVLVVTVPADIQRQRVLSRPGMTEDTFELLLSKQLPDVQKRQRADYVIESVERDATREAVLALIETIRGKASIA